MRKKNFQVALYETQIPLNLGAIMRTCAEYGLNAGRIEGLD